MYNIYSINEIKYHNTVNDCWLISNNKVYNASSFLRLHPAHTNRIMKNAGKDVTKDFNFHTKNQQKEWNKYLIGYIDKIPNKCFCIPF